MVLVWALSQRGVGQPTDGRHLDCGPQRKSAAAAAVLSEAVAVRVLEEWAGGYSREDVGGTGRWAGTGRETGGDRGGFALGSASYCTACGNPASCPI
eukprot:366154-Chlamydomonas_euryale.AAC.10